MTDLGAMSIEELDALAANVDQERERRLLPTQIAAAADRFVTVGGTRAELVELIAEPTPPPE